MSFVNENISHQLPVMEQFYTLQGEGQYAGHAAYFIRLAGCDVGCVWCDVKASWEVSPDQWQEVEDIVQEVMKYPTRIVVITGGEPAMYQLDNLTSLLHQKGYQVHIETSGAYPLSGQLDWVTVSPKKFKSSLPDVLKQADELKVIIYNSSDFKWAEQHEQAVRDDCKLLLQVEWSRRDRLLPEILEYIKSHPRWSLSMQTHKYLDIP